ncbi:alpha/beta hydrolase fold domain-containing protein [uncultured Kordia sp.]|uniref:alpha/beta hydrolase fold domain-containing protein n=1 Tax=uncultured Kordia sp. TaxID=507699 RepID=UPI002607D662|nr:alpha/beta hydrolase fold domain-containing protein [uncultured Kordia sp.]
MKQSLSYYITKAVLKLKGIKKTFSQDPVNVKKIRKEDVFVPKGSFYKKNVTREFQIEKTSITEIKTQHSKDTLLMYIHGGAFISGPAKHHWDSLKTIAKETNCIIWMCKYPKAPEHNITEISQNIDAVYKEALQKYPADQIILMGDSVGGTLITALTQRLRNEKVALPQKIMLICPVMDSTLQNPDIEKVDKIDPMLSKAGILSAKKMCAGDEGLHNVMISPLNGNFEGFPKTILCVAAHDIMYPDQLLTVDKMKKAKVDLELIEGKNMPHIWPLLPVMKEAKVALQLLIEKIKE